MAADTDVSHLLQISKDFSAFLLSGRPFGGVAILWSKTIGAGLSPVFYDDARLMVLIISTNKFPQGLIVYVYTLYSCTENINGFNVLLE